MNAKLKREVLKVRAERSTKVRPGWKRFTTYYSHENIEYIKTEAAKRKMWVMDVIAEMIDGAIRRTK